MPELPEVETIRRGLNRTVVGKMIKDVEVRLPKIVSLGPAVVSNIRRSGGKKVGKFRKFLKNLKVESVKRRGKMLVLKLSKAPSLFRRLPAGRQGGEAQPPLHLPLSKKGEKREGVARARGEGNMVLLIHLKMTGQLIYAKSGERKEVKVFNTQASPRLALPHKYTHVIFDFADGSHLYFNDLRQFGYLRLVGDNALEQVREFREYGPEPLSARFSLAYLLERASRRPNLSVKQFLMEPKVVAGIGNIYSDEILYWAGIRPNRKVRTLKKPEWQKIYQVIPRVLKKALAARGSSVGDFFQVDGTEGKFGRQHMVYGRAGEKCKKCGTIVKSLKLGGRTSSYCPKCQK